MEEELIGVNIFSGKPCAVKSIQIQNLSIRKQYIKKPNILSSYLKIVENKPHKLERSWSKEIISINIYSGKPCAIESVRIQNPSIRKQYMKETKILFHFPVRMPPCFIIVRSGINFTFPRPRAELDCYRLLMWPVTTETRSPSWSHNGDLTNSPFFFVFSPAMDSCFFK